jgi:2-octaprenylphenol hydroxylase
MSAQPAYDVVIVGAGAVGATLALALARQGRRVVLVDGRPGPTEAPGAEHGEFVVSLNLASIALLRHLGVWASVHDTRVSPYGAMALWDAGGGGETVFDSTAVGEPALGCFVEAALLDARLHEALAEQTGITCRWGQRARGLQALGDRARLTLDDASVLEARLVVGADGGRSALRQLAGIGVARHDYDQHAIVCNFATERGHGAVARQRFMRGGPVAMLPLADGRCSLAWFRPPAQADELVARTEADFCAALSTATDHALGAVTAATRRRAFPIVRRHAASYVGTRLALVGDAAHTIHPQGGQGLNLGLMDAGALAETIAHAGDAGGERGLRAYARGRRGHNLAVMQAMDVFHHGFARGPVPAAVRNAGLALAQRSGPGKRLVLRRGAGLAGDLPVSARPPAGYGIGP